MFQVMKIAATIVAVIVLFIALLWSMAALAQHPQHGSDHFYATWLRPEMRTQAGQRQYSCCNERDCAPARFKNVGGAWFGQKLGTTRWQPIPDRLMEQNQPDPRESPDGQSHLCSTEWHVFCAVLGSAM